MVGREPKSSPHAAPPSSYIAVHAVAVAGVACRPPVTAEFAIIKTGGFFLHRRERGETSFMIMVLSAK